MAEIQLSTAESMIKLITAQSMLTKRPILRITLPLFFLLNISSHISCLRSLMLLVSEFYRVGLQDEHSFRNWRSTRLILAPIFI